MVRQSEKGLALLLVVSLMALVTLLVVSLAVVTRVETQVGATRATQDQARQNAQLAVQVALGQLQELAGPDRRVTATAEATGSTSNRHWTGVWRSDTNGTAPLAWLVSGEGSDPSNDATPSRERVVLVGESNGSEETEVVAPLEHEDLQSELVGAALRDGESEEAGAHDHEVGLLGGVSVRGWHGRSVYG